MDLNELRTVRRTEREKDSLQSLRDTFYEDVAAYLTDLTDRRDQAAAKADDPFGSEEVRRLTDEIETAEEIAEAIYERRVGKVVKLASFAAADMGVETDGMTAHEQELFEDLVARIKENKTTVLDVLAGETEAASVSVSEPESAPTDASSASEPEAAEPESEGVLAEAMGDVGADPSSTADGGDAAASPASDPPPSPIPGDADSNPTAGTVDEEVQPSTAESSEDGRTPVAPEPATAVAGAEGEAGTQGTSQSRDGDTERTTVRITRDVGSIFGTDEREYDLEREDVVTLPSANAEPLLERDAAEKLE